LKNNNSKVFLLIASNTKKLKNDRIEGESKNWQAIKIHLVLE
jgi:hypothetical protein